MMHCWVEVFHIVGLSIMMQKELKIFSVTKRNKTVLRSTYLVISQSIFHEPLMLTLIFFLFLFPSISLSFGVADGEC